MKKLKTYAIMMKGEQTPIIVDAYSKKDVINRLRDKFRPLPKTKDIYLY